MHYEVLEVAIDSLHNTNLGERTRLNDHSVCIDTLTERNCFKSQRKLP